MFWGFSSTFGFPILVNFGGLMGDAGTVRAQSPLLRGGVGTASRTKIFEFQVSNCYPLLDEINPSAHRIFNPGGKWAPRE